MNTHYRVPFNLSGNSLSFFAKGKQHVVDSSHPSWDEIKELLKDGTTDADQLVELADIRETIRQKVAQYGDVEVGYSSVLYKGQPVHNHLTDRLLRFASEGYDIAPWARFLDNLMKNPSKTAVDELYLWLEKSGLAITEEGNFVAFKKVRNDYLSYYDGKTSNQIGEVVEMDRNQVDDRREHTCSYGLHFCSWSYLPSYYGNCGRVLVLEINPADVVSIPSDYDNAKGRAFRYVVIGEIPEDQARFAFSEAVFNPVTAPAGSRFIYDEDGYDIDGYDSDGYDRDGNHRDEDDED